VCVDALHLHAWVLVGMGELNTIGISLASTKSTFLQNFAESAAVFAIFGLCALGGCMGFMYRAGQVVGKNKAVAGMLLAALAAVSAYQMLTPTRTQVQAGPPAAVFDPSTTPGAIARAQAEAQRVKLCSDGLADLMAQARQSLRSNDPERAYGLLNPCRVGMSNDAAKSLMTEITNAANRKTEAARLAAEKSEKARRKKAGVSIGMTEEEVLQSSWGAPRTVNKTTRANSISAQWVYDGGYLYFENGALRTIQH